MDGFQFEEVMPGAVGRRVPGAVGMVVPGSAGTRVPPCWDVLGFPAEWNSTGNTPRDVFDVRT